MVLLGRLGLGLGLGFRVRVSINIKYILYFIHALHFIHLHSVGGATVSRTGPSSIVHLMPILPNWAVHRAGPSNFM